MTNKEKICTNIMKFIFGVLFVVFLIIYCGGFNTYYESKLHEKRLFTEEKIKQFENDVASGLDVRIESYLDDQQKNYHNKLSDVGYFLSNLIGNGFKKGVEKAFHMISKFIE